MAARRFWLMGLVLALSACAGPRPVSETVPRVHHVVLCWLKDPDSEADRHTLIEASRSLRNIPGVRELHVGPSLPSERAIVDDSFDVGLYFRFDSVEAMQRYLHHPDHVRAVRQVIAPLTRQLRVHDFISPN